MRRALVLLCIAAARDHGAAIADDNAAAGLERAKRWRDGCGFRGYAATDAAPDAACDAAATDAAPGAACDAAAPARELCGGRALPVRAVRESRCAGGRGNSTTPPHAAQEVVVVPELKLVWLVNRKAASSTIRAALTRHFDAYWTKCGDVLDVGACGVLGGRCSTLCLTAEQIDTYFFFAFVRDPAERFYSALKESARMAHALTPADLDESDARRVLAAVEGGACGVDHHLESQALALSSPVAFSCRGERLAVPVDFVGRVDALADDFLAMLRAAAPATGRALDAAELAAVARSLRTNVGNVGAGRAYALRSDDLDARVRAVYDQDEACFSG